MTLSAFIAKWNMYMGPTGTVLAAAAVLAVIGVSIYMYAGRTVSEE